MWTTTDQVCPLCSGRR